MNELEAIKILTVQVAAVESWEAGEIAAAARRLALLNCCALADRLGPDGCRDGAFYWNGQRFEPDMPPRLWLLLGFLFKRGSVLVPDLAAFMGKPRRSAYSQLRQEVARLNRALFISGCRLSFEKSRESDRIEARRM